MFDELFPRSSSYFDTSALTATEWRKSMDEETLGHVWTICIWADDLLRMAASFRGEGDLFLRRRFSDKHIMIREEFALAGRRKRTVPVQQGDKAAWVGFLDFRLSDEMLAQLDDWKPRPADLWAEIDAAIAAGYRFTLSYNSKTHLASCTMICDDPVSKWGGYALSSADEDGALALKMAVFKHIKLNRDWTELLGVVAPRGKRG